MSGHLEIGSDRRKDGERITFHTGIELTDASVRLLEEVN
mgnify:CR=1 FL=1